MTTTRKPRLLDLYCKAGGAGMGYYRVGFEVVGVDIESQPRYPFEFLQADALEYLAAHWQEFDVIHASPPCQKFTKLNFLHKREHPDLVDDTRNLLREIGKPYVIENVPGAPLLNPLTLCGSMFGLKVIRHRIFETNPVVWFPPFTCRHDTGGIPNAGRGANEGGYITVVGHFPNVDAARAAMGIGWMTRDELSQAIPPAYTEWVGKQLLAIIQQKELAQ